MALPLPLPSVVLLLPVGPIDSLGVLLVDIDALAVSFGVLLVVAVICVGGDLVDMMYSISSPVRLCMVNCEVPSSLI